MVEGHSKHKGPCEQSGKELFLCDAEKSRVARDTQQKRWSVVGGAQEAVGRSQIMQHLLWSIYSQSKNKGIPGKDLHRGTTKITSKAQSGHIGQNGLEENRKLVWKLE